MAKLESDSKFTLYLLAVIAGVSVANTYYLQPLLYVISRSFSRDPKTIGTLVTLAQVGYALGLATLVPLADRISKRTIISLGLAVAAAISLFQSLTTNFILFEVAVFLVGTVSIVAQVAVAFSATVSTHEGRGSAVSKVMAGLLSGILLARTAAGVIAEIAGYKTVYLSAAVAGIALAIVAWLKLPSDQPSHTLSYPKLLSSTAKTFLHSKLLRRRAYFGALGFAGFSIFWTVLAPYLSIAPFNLNTVEIGFIGIAGLAGVAAARVAGWAVDKGYARISTPGSWAIIAGSFIALYLARHSLLAIVIVAATLDLGIQGIHITNQSIIYRISPDSQARITTAYMGTYFIGGAIGSALATVTYANFQYAGTALLGVGVSFLGILLWYFGRKKEAALIQRMGGLQPDRT